jgi:hypothetical protein
LLVRGLSAEQRQESFERDPGWDGHNNRATDPGPRGVRQDFGYSRTQNTGGEAPGEMGGLVHPAAEPAYYAKRIPTATFSDRLTASGRLACAGRHFHALVGFFNAETLGDWRTPNSIVLRLYGRGDVFYAYVEYATSRWRAGGDSPGGFATVTDPETGRPRLRGFASQGAVHWWSLSYDPQGGGGNGSVTVTIDDETAVCHLDPGHKQDGATFNRFGLMNVAKHYDTGGELWLDDVTINGELEDFGRDPGWDEHDNRRTFTTVNVRPRFNFGFSPTQFAGGRTAGELGGLVFRGDNRYAERLAYYGDRLETLSLERPLRASGRVSLRRGISDSTTLIGFFHSRESIAVSDTPTSGFPACFLGAAIEGPSREGFLLYPVYRFSRGGEAYPRDSQLPHILPDGSSHDWTLAYDPVAADANGRITVTFDGQVVQLDLAAGDRDARTGFDRFGIVTTWIDGNGQHVYFDDLAYTFRQEP